MHVTDEMAPGGPGEPPHWTRGEKWGVGTAITPTCSGTSLVWFALGPGVLDEIYYTRLDCPCARGLDLIVTDGSEFISDERSDAEHRLDYLEKGAPAFHLVNTCRRGRYRIAKTVLSHPYQEVLLQRARFEPLVGSLEDYHLYVLLWPHLGRRGVENTAWIGDHKGVPMLFAHRAEYALALAGSAPWICGSAGYVGTSDGWLDLSRNKRLTRTHGRAETGNVMLTGEVDLRSCGGEFLLVLAFGPNPDEAGHRALAALNDEFEALREDYLQGWRAWQRSLRPPLERDGGLDGGHDLYRLGAAVLRVHEGKTVPGSAIASLSIPWGQEAQGDGSFELGGYHLIWPRDLVQAAGGFLAVGAGADALCLLDYLRDSQEADGHWPQNMWVSSRRYWDGIQLGETALPILLVDLLRREGVLGPDRLARYWPMARRAAAYLVQNGPSTQQDRWENERGYTPYTLASCIAALLVAAERAEAHGETGVADYLRETADTWNASIESWLYVAGTELAHRVGVAGYYARIIPPELVESSTPRMGHLSVDRPIPRKNGVLITEVVSADALALVRFGLRAPDDPRIADTVRVLDALTRVETPAGPSWRRYNGDRYGEHEDGSPFTTKNKGRGRAWPLLTAERAHYELAAGRRNEALRLLRAVEAFTNAGGMISEQVWDEADRPDKGLYRGRPTGSAAPLVWAHAEYLKLRRSLADGRIFDLPPQAAWRYLAEPPHTNRLLWHFQSRLQVISAGESLRLEVLKPALVRYTTDDWWTHHEDPTRDTGLGVHVADLPTQSLPSGSRIRFTFYWNESKNWESQEIALRVV